MDKQTTDAIKIKINGKDRPLSDEENTEVTIPITSWDEKLEAKNEVASAKQPLEKEDDFPWLLPEDEDSIFLEDPKVVVPSKKNKQYSNQSITPFHYPKKQKRINEKTLFPIKKIMLMILLAIALGVMFGSVLLNFLSNDDMPVMGTPSGETGDNRVAVETPDKATDEGKTAVGTEEPGAETTATLQLFAVQGGVYSSKEAADSVATEIKGKGQAAIVLESNETFTVFVGVSKEKDETGALSEVYKQQDFTTDIEFWGGKQLSFLLGTSASADQWVKSIQELSTLASISINGTNINENDISKIESTLNGIKANDTEKPLIETLLQSIESLKSNNGWKAQQQLMDVISKLNIK